MRLVTSKYLIRTALILFAIQVFVPSFIASPPVEYSTPSNHQSLHKHEAQPFSAASLPEKTETENEEERDKSLAVEIFDIAIANRGRISASQVALHTHTISQHIREPLLIILYCVYQI